MDPMGAAAAAAGNRRPPGSRLFLASLVGMAVATSVGSYAAREAAQDAAAADAQRLAERAAAAVETRFDAAAAGLAGADVLVGPDGGLSVETFRTFAEEAVRGGGLSGLALVAPVPEEDRAAFERSIGRPLYVADADGVRPAPATPVHDVIVAVEPRELDAIVGFDYGNDPERGPALRAAATADDLVVLEVVELQAIGGPGTVVVRPVGEGSEAEPPGFLLGALAADSLLASVDGAIGARDVAQIVTGDDLVIGDEIDADAQPAVVPLAVPGQQWELRVVRGAGPDLTLARLVVILGAAGVLVLLTLFLLTRRHHKDLSRANAQLRAAEARARAVQDLVGNLSRSLSGDQVATGLLRRLPAIVGASAGVVLVRDENGALSVLAADGHSDAELEIMTDPDLQRDSHVTRTIEELTPRWLASPLAWRGDVVTAAAAGEGNWALALVPLVAGQLRGALVVSYPSVHTFAEVERELLVNIGLMTARSLARARQYDAEHAAALAFQRAALPDALPEVAGLGIAARYRPASRRAAVGGDWYDVIVLDDGEPKVACLVGDVVGHGMSAAAAMGRLRTACRAVAPLRPDPGDLVQAISEQAGGIRDAVCTTMVCATVDVGSGVVAWSRAGHPPPLLLDGDGSARFLDDPPLPPLGVVALDPPSEPTYRVDLRAGETLVLYTDGVIERREERLDDSLRRFAVVCGSLADLDIEGFCDALLEAMVPGSEQADDIALLVVRMEAPAPG